MSDPTWTRWEAKARGILGKGKDWCLIEAARIPETGPLARLRLRGGIARPYLRGPNKGEPNPRTVLLRDCDTVYLTRRQVRTTTPLRPVRQAAGAPR